MAGARSRVKVGALLVLAICFLVSALIRVGDVVAALPEEDASSDLVNEPLNTEVKKKGAGSVGNVRAPEDVVAELRRQRELLDAREVALEERDQQLRALQKRISNRLEELKSERKRLEETATVVNDAAGKDVRLLAQMYGQMKPKQAALIFDQMAPSFAAGFLSQMRPEAAALIMQNMQAERAHAVSVLMAGRNVDRDGGAAPVTE